MKQSGRTRNDLLKILCRFLFLSGFLFLGTTLFAATSDVDRIEQDLNREVARLERELTALGHLSADAVPASLPARFAMVQSGVLNVEGQYMSEVGNINDFSQEAFRFLQGLPADRRGPHPDLTDLLVALWKTSPDRQRTAGNGYMIIDYFIHSHCSSVLIKKLTADGSDLARHMFARRLFSDMHMMLSQITWLRKPHTPKVAKEPPAMVKTLIRPLLNLPGELGRAVKDTLNLLGIEDLTAAVFTEYAMRRLQDPKVGKRLLALYDGMQEIWHPLWKQHSGVSAPHTARTAPPPALDLWNLALSVCGGDISSAVELLGVFTTQHRTLVKSILPRCPTREAQFPLIGPLIRTSSNFFMVQEINILTRAEDGTFRFAYPQGWTSDDPRYYHFWSEVFVTWTLLQKGYRPEIVRLVIDNLGRAYELYTLPNNLRFADKSDAPVGSVVQGLRQDVKTHKMGCEFAVSLWQKHNTSGTR
ncbi:MAG: hypothetical protein WA705_25700 [Candidatus Ozemobacteraceae bacterium]